MKTLASALFVAISLSGLAAADQEPSIAEQACLNTYNNTKKEVSEQQTLVLQIVENQVAASPACTCEIVRAAIESTNKKPENVAAIVEAAGLAAPEHLRLAAQCAIAVAPEALASVQAVVSRLDTNSGEAAESSKSSSKDAKDAKGVSPSMPDPLNPLNEVLDPPPTPVIGPVSPP